MENLKQQFVEYAKKKGWHIPPLYFIPKGVWQFINDEFEPEQANPVDALVSLPPIKWQYEDELPELTDKEYDEMFDFSRVIDGVRMFPYMVINNAKHYLRSN